MGIHENYLAKNWSIVKANNIHKAQNLIEKPHIMDKSIENTYFVGYLPTDTIRAHQEHALLIIAFTLSVMLLLTILLMGFGILETSQKRDDKNKSLKSCFSELKDVRKLQLI